MELSIEQGAATDVGRIRDRNEDGWIAIPGVGLFAVADGMGGHAAGEVASRLALETLSERLSGGPPADRETVADALREAVVAAGRRIREEATRDPNRAGMGTTVTALQLLAGGDAVLAHVGDSRAYLFRAGTLRRLTRDHTWVQEQVERGQLTEEGARIHPAASMLTRAVGTEETVRADIVDCHWRPGDVFLLCSDGLTGPVSEPEIEAVLAAGSNPGEEARALVDLALRRGGPDNVTAVVVRPAAQA